MRKPVIAGNWKMHKMLGEAVETVLDLKPLVSNANHCDIVIAPVFVQIKTLADRLDGSSIKIAAQDCAPIAEQSANTGEVSAQMLKDVGASYIITGHSERRQFYFESDNEINRKIKCCVQAGLYAIACVGENLSEREQGEAEQIVESQILKDFEGLTVSDMERIIIAYEPVWAIGTGKTATPEQAQEMHRFIRQTISKVFGEETSEKIRILYGGSVKPGNIKDLMNQNDIDGALIGGASLEAESFAAIVNYK